MPTEILRKNGSNVEFPTGQYTVTPEDRDEFSIRFSDPTYADWRDVSVDNVQKTSDLILPGCKFMIISLFIRDHENVQMLDFLLIRSHIGDQ